MGTTAGQARSVRETTTRAVVLTRRPVGQVVRVEDFEIADIGLPALGPDEVLVENHYMSVDPSTRGRLEDFEKHYTQNFALGAPLDGMAVGQVVASKSADVPEGAWVRHQLGWREHSVVRADEVRRIRVDRAPAPYWLGVLGLTGLTAYVGLTEIAQIVPGDTVWVSGAAGGVGSVAGQMARNLGAVHVVGTAGGPDKARALVDDFGFDAGLDYREPDLAGRLRAASADGYSVYFDNVGGEQLTTALDLLNPFGRIALCGMISNFGVDFSAQHQGPAVDQLIQAVLKRLTLRGFIARDHFDLQDKFEDDVIGWIDRGEMVVMQTVREGIADAPEALIGVLTGANLGKMLVKLA
ncbi:NADP-dependent oxidoreductase [Actinomadura rugatobispora]|uniref:NADP-dependent oxidoreductase n=1 Tax=Actinomadura rugatobispora TaxID=1994 RepID=A0ABW0ZV08_9ACTN|nr:NADP-dependent oxidoreductase [Actinomadura rugatobispora]